MQGFLVVLPLVILMLIGAVSRKIKFLDEHDVTCLAKLVYWVISPAVIFRGALQLEMNWASQVNYAAAIYVSAIVIMLLVYLFGRFVLKNAGGDILPISVLASFRSNSMMVGMPVVMLALGDAGIAPVAVYYAVTEAGYCVLMIVGAEMTRGAGREARRMLVKTLKGIAVNPLIWASLSGLALSLLGFHALPAPVDTVFSMIMNMAGGASLLMIGASLDLRAIGKNIRPLLPDCAVRLLIHPALLWLCFRAFPVQAEIMQTAVIMTAASAPNMAFIMAQGMGLDTKYAAGLIGITTIAFIATMPLWLNGLRVV